MDELKPCPFCGSKVAGDKDFFIHPKSDCMFSQWEFAKSDAGEKWNQRAFSDLNDAEIDAIADSMDGGIDGFLKGWGWRQFARAVIERMKGGGE